MSQKPIETSATAVDSGHNTTDDTSSHGEKQDALAHDSGGDINTRQVEPEYYYGLRLWIIMSTIFLSTLLSALDIVSWVLPVPPPYPTTTNRD